jgi:hypothetical protein
MDSILGRVNRVAESILENESLTADLNDEAAGVLIDWGIARAKEVAYSTLEIVDDDQAEEAMYVQMRALRRILRTANQWATKISMIDKEYGESALASIIEQAAILFGQTYVPPNEASCKDLINRQNSPPAAFIANLLDLIEKPQPTY